MKKRQKISKNIRWNETVGGVQRNENVAQKSVSGMAEILLGLVCMLIFMISARTMLEDVYSWSVYSAYTIAFAFFLMLLVGVVMQSSYYVKKRLGTVIRWSVFIVIILACIWYWHTGDNGEHISSGLREAYKLYIIDWNKYYSASMDALAGNILYVEEALNYLFLCLFLGFFWLAMTLKKNLVMVIVPVLVVALELLVGYSPGEMGLLLMFTGVLLSNAANWKKPEFRLVQGKRNAVYRILNNFTWIAVGVIVLLTYGAVKLIGSSSAEEIVEQADNFKNWQKDFIESVRNWSVFDGDIGDDGIFDGILNGNWGNTDPKWEELSNDRPNYTGKRILTLSMKIKPTESVYLKGYYANDYVNGVWKYSTEDFIFACYNAGYTPSDMYEHIAMLGIDKVMLGNEVYLVEDLPTASTASITYLNATGTRAYYPYFMKPAMGEGTTATGEGRYTKKSNVNKVFFQMWDYDPSYEKMLSMFENVGKYDWEEWYEDYVMEHYLDVPAGMPSVTEVAIEILGTNLIGQVEGINAYRMAYAYAVAKWMRNNTKYSLDLPKLPEGADPVEYFLGNSRMGYCMHYASASTMILRELGVPARYATGYVVNPSLFTEKNGQYVANVPDDRAHAWVEIYLEGIGWVPVEVTNGYDITELGTIDNENPTEEGTTEGVSEDITSSTSENTNEYETTSEMMSQNVPQIGTTISPEESSGSLVGGDGNSENGTGSHSGTGAGTLKLVLIIVGIVSMGALMVCVIWRIKVNYHNKLVNAINKKRTLRAIKIINHRIYRKLRMMGKIIKSNPSDGYYEEILKKTYTEVNADEWGKYMDIVKAAAFSNKEFSVEEMEFCYNIYNKINKK